ncbi:MAG: hypothetical protein NTZ27_01050 [Ignavibacteriales bacterium]|nr:hypothetical protein [Ignavibacteriales bacterium]
MKHNILILTLTVITIFILITSCSKSDSNNPANPSATAPAIPALSYPAHNSTNVSTTLILNWNASSNAASYGLQVASNSSFTNLVFDQKSITTTSQQITQLLTSTKYYWRVNASNSAGTSDWSDYWAFTTTAGGSVPSIPTLFMPPNNATNISTSPTLSWNESSGAKNYSLSVWRTDNGLSVFLGYVTGTSQQLTGLENNVNYTWYVNANNDYGSSGWSDRWNFTTSAGNPPAGPPVLTSPTNSAINISLNPTCSWNASAGAANYNLLVSTENIFSNIVFTGETATTSLQVTGLNNSITYYWKVKAINNYGSSNWSSIWSFTTLSAGTAPDPPTLYSPSNGAANVEIPTTLTWYVNTGATSYALQVSSNSSFSDYIYNQSGLTKVNQMVTGLSNLTTYYWRVSSANIYGSSAYSSAWSFTTASSGGTPCVGTPTVNYGSKTYHTVQIGTQCWLKENLDIGTMKLGTEEQTDNGTIEKYCFNDDPYNCALFGGLYEWNEAMQYDTTQKAQGVCPSGWHLPNLEEFQTLITAVNNDGNALKEIGQGTGNGAGTNTSGFSALLAGYRYSDGRFLEFGQSIRFWISTEKWNTHAYDIGLFNINNFIFVYYTGRNIGYYVRCVKD